MPSPEIPNFDNHEFKPNLQTTIERLSKIEVTDDGIEASDLIEFADLRGELELCFGSLNHFIVDKRITEYHHNNEEGYDILNPESINGRYKDLCVHDIGDGNKIYARFVTFSGADIKNPYRTLILEGYALIPIDSETSIVAVPESEEVNGSQFFEDDMHVEALDTILLNGTIDIDDLEKYVTTELSVLGESLIDEYLKYATKVFENIPMGLAANRIFYFSSDDRIELCSDEPVYMNGTIEGINLMSVTFEEDDDDEHDKFRLGFAFKYNGVYFCVLAEDVVSIEAY